MLSQLLIFFIHCKLLPLYRCFRFADYILKCNILCRYLLYFRNKNYVVNYVTDLFASIQKIILCSNIKFELTIQQKFNLMPSRTNNV